MQPLERQPKVRKAIISAAVLSPLVTALVLWLFCLPRDLFRNIPTSTVVEDANGELLGARVAADGQWRFPPSPDVPDKYARCLLLFEDRYFHVHHGVNPVSVVRAAVSNIRAGKVVSGGSTITMQVIRLSRPGSGRTFGEKILEAIMATRLESRCSKQEILALYASYAPFGGNVVGLEAASWRYFGHSSSQLSWAEAATLAVLPNSPSLIHPGRNRNLLKDKRNRLLAKVLAQGWTDSLTYSLAVAEPLPDKPEPLLDHAFHLVQNLSLSAPGERVRTDIDSRLQSRVEQTLDRWSEDFARSGIEDLAAVVIDTHTGNTLAYIGNSRIYASRPGSLVDIASSPRSTGSILKPFLYGALLQNGTLLPHSLLPDYPVNYGGFIPHNASRSFSGAVPASEALVRSLNVPSVEMLRRYGTDNFQNFLQKAGMTTLNRPSSDYGLSLILGGAEGRLDEITRMYACISGKYLDCEWVDAEWPLTDKCTIYYMVDALKNLDRPDELDRSLIPALSRIAWKTGTSYGGRDAWAVGVTPDYAVGVWAGNADGASSPDLFGARTAGPVLFDIFNLLPASVWFSEPWSPFTTCAPVIPDREINSSVVSGPNLASEGVWALVCRESGMLKSRFCPHADSLVIPQAGLKSRVCPYHRPVTVTADGKRRLNSPAPGSRIEYLFVLPPAMEYYYRRIHPEYSGMPPLDINSYMDDGISRMAFIYPQNGVKIKTPPQPDMSRGEIVASLAVSSPEEEVFWHLDSEYLGSTVNIHKMSIRPSAGNHVLTAVDERGFAASVSFKVE